MPINKTHKVVILGVKAERIGEGDKIKCIIKTAALDIENNFLDTEMMGIFVDGEQVTQDASDPQGELTITLQLDYKPEQEALAIHVQHLATSVSSPRKYVPIGITGQKQDIPMPEADKVPLDKSTVIAIMQKDGMKLGDPEYIPYNDDFSIVLSAVKQNGIALQFASDRLKNETSIVDEALCQDADYIYLASEEQQKIYAMQVREAIDKLNNECTVLGDLHYSIFDKKYDNGKTVFQNLPGKLKYNHDILVSAVQIYRGLIFNYMPPTIRDNVLQKKSFVLKALTFGVCTFDTLSESLRSDPDIKRAAGK